MADHDDDHVLQAMLAADCTRSFVLMLQEENSVPIGVILSGAHAQITTMMALALGPEEAAKLCEKAADNLRTLPSQEEVELATVKAAGNA